MKKPNLYPEQNYPKNRIAEINSILEEQQHYLLKKKPVKMHIMML